MKQTETAASVGANESRLLTTEEAAAYLGITPYTVRRWRSDGRGPRWVRVGRLSRYRIEDLEAYAAAHVVTPGAQA